MNRAEERAATRAAAQAALNHLNIARLWLEKDRLVGSDREIEKAQNLLKGLLSKAEVEIQS